jgi:hypothetical protein
MLKTTTVDVVYFVYVYIFHINRSNRWKLYLISVICLNGKHVRANFEVSPRAQCLVATAPGAWRCLGFCNVDRVPCIVVPARVSHDFICRADIRILYGIVIGFAARVTQRRSRKRFRHTDHRSGVNRAGARLNKDAHGEHVHVIRSWTQREGCKRVRSRPSGFGRKMNIWKRDGQRGYRTHPFPREQFSTTSHMRLFARITRCVAPDSIASTASASVGRQYCFRHVRLADRCRGTLFAGALQ